MPSFLSNSHDPWIVAASLAIATLAAYVALDLSMRVRSASGHASTLWWLAGSLVMGTGIWSMHFVGMLALLLPIQLGFTGLLTLASWLAAVVASGVALRSASVGAGSVRSVAGASLAMAAGICGMHYIGMAALDMAPGIVWSWGTVVLSAMVALAASAVALMVFRHLPHVKPTRRFVTQGLAAIVMGAGIGAMHYTGMAAARFPVGSVCLSADALSGKGLTAIVVLATCMLLLGTLLASMLERRLQSVARQLSTSLQESNAQLKTANDELRDRAFADPLTNLPNRLLFEDRLAHALERSVRAAPGAPPAQLAVLFLDLDGFKPVNDSLGHAAGDSVLRATAERLLAHTRAGDTVARVGGDEFVALLDGFNNEAECSVLLQNILNAIKQPFDVMGRSVQIACSIGVALHPGPGERDKLVAHADAAMYAAKRAGGSRYVMFEAHMAAEIEATLQYQAQLRQAVSEGQFELYYQPKIDARRNRLSGVEALVRWNHPTLGLVGPGSFIPLAERTGLIGPLGAWVIHEACRQIAEWAAAGTQLRVAINLSPLQLAEPALIQTVRHALQAHGVAGSQLICEVTESAALQDLEATQRTFNELLRIGVHLSIDDFGTGYSSLSQLRQLPARQLKVDRSFVVDLETSADAREVVHAVIKLAHALNLTVVAEGVETLGQRDILLGMRCDEMQGYFYARPMPAAAIRSWVLDAPPVPYKPTVPGALER